MKKLSLFLALTLVVSVLATGCGGGGGEESQESDVIKIGVLAPLTGGDAAGGILEKEGIDLANELYPQVMGKDIELVYADNKSEKVEAATAARNLVDKEKVTAVLGSWGSGYSIAAGPVFKEAQVPAIGTSCTNPLVTLDNDYYFRACFTDTFQGVVMANYAFNDAKVKKVAIIQEVSNDYSVALAQIFTTKFIELTGDENAIVANASYNSGDQDFTAQLTSIKNSGAEAIFAPGTFGTSGLLMKQARELGITLPFLGADTWETPVMIEIGGSGVEGCVFSTFFDAATPLTETTTIFLDAYKEKYGEDAEPAAVTALAFDAYLLARDAIERAGTTDGPAIRDAIAATKDFPGAAGIINLDENGDAIKPAIIKTIQDGKFVYKTTVNPE